VIRIIEDSVQVFGKRFDVEKGELDLSGKGITSISDIKNLSKIISLKKLLLADNKILRIEGLDRLTQLKDLDLSNNLIGKIEGLDSLANLVYLNLSNNKIQRISNLDRNSNLEYLCLSNNIIKRIEGLTHLSRLEALALDGNQIEKIEGLEQLVNNFEFRIDGNHIPRNILDSIEVPFSGDTRDGKKFVEYCVKNLKKNKVLDEQSSKEKLDKNEVIDKIKKILHVSSRVRIEMMRNALEMDEKEFDAMIFNWAFDYGFKIDGDYIIIENVNIDDFISNLDSWFKNWGAEEREKSQKL